jgi:hypothetical protein
LENAGDAETVQREFKQNIEIEELRRLNYRELGFKQEVDKEFVDILIGMQK